ncbi:hypothetical protein KC19_4G191800 [Ceratodon purpureus]|uniref:Protein DETOXIFICATION n=1 Tax=Ceratodon purpureus TaxID=3225 RepID=A0A8T0ICQ1_CERPU|nr:hypothetical protein KC19_4G191800 [Ceratodon purpureus]
MEDDDQSTMAMAMGEEFAEPLINGEINPPTVTSSVFTVAENYIAVTRPLSDGHGNNPVSHDPEEKGTSRWVWAEVREQCWLAGPIMGMYLLQYVMAIAGVVFIGHLGSFPLAAASLTNSFCGITGFTFLAGLASALETLCGQAYGAKQYHLLGIYLQRAVFILLVAAVPVGILWLNMASILVALGEDPVIAHAAQSYVHWLLPVLVSYGMLFPLIKFFQTQRAVFQLMICSAVTVVFHVPLCWLIIDKLQVGLNGAAIAMNISMFFNLCLLFSFLRFSSRFEKTFISFSWEAFQDFGDFFRLAIPSAIMMCLEHWCYEILTLVAGVLPNSQLVLASFSICMGLLALSNMTSLALGVATSVRVSNELGAGKPHAARSVVAVSLVLGLVNGSIMASLIYSLRNVWGWGFTNDAEVVQQVAHIVPYLSGLAIIYAIQAILSGVVRGIGWQRAGAMANLGAYYGVGLPVALLLVFKFELDGRGLWLGMGCGLLTQTMALISVLMCTNWDKLAQEALLRSLSFSARLPTLAPPALEKPLLEDERSHEDLQRVSSAAA